MDAQTLLDLEILESADGNKNYLLHLLNYTITQGGEDVLKHKLIQPFTSLKKITEQQTIIKQLIPLVEIWYEIINKRDIAAVEQYLQSNIQIIDFEADFFDKWRAKLFKWQHPDYFHYLHSNIIVLQNLLENLKKFIEQYPKQFPEWIDSINSIIHQISENLFSKNTTLLSNKTAFTTLFIDEQIRKNKANNIKNILEWIYETDAIISMAKACVEHRLVFPELTSSPGINFIDLRHLMVKNPISNDLHLTHQNILFVTGPNMAGKTTYLKSIAHAIILTHMGMGIPAKKGIVGVFNNLFSFIGITDSISKGESYFQSEINRIKLLAECLQKHEKVALIMDEPFKGTNIKDALDCTILFTQLALQWQNSYFIMATHLTEIYANFKDNSRVAFYYFETKQQGSQLIFNYKCQQGISEQRLGLAIFKQTGLPTLMTPKKYCK